MNKENHYKKTAEFHKKAALEKDGFYDAKNKLKHHPVQLWARKTIVNLLKFVCGDGNKILDAGCGRGDFSLKLSNLFKNSKITGLDCVDEMLEIAKKITKDRNNINFVKGNLLNMSFPNGYFDITICNNALHHIH